MNDTINVKKDQLARLITLMSSVIDNTTKTGNANYVRTGATIEIGDVTSNGADMLTETTGLDMRDTLDGIMGILNDVHDATNHCLRISIVTP